MSQPQTSGAVRVIKEVPLTWLIGVGAFLCAQAAIVYFAQQEQGKAIVQQSEAIRDLVTQVRSLSTELSGKNLKDVEHDLRIADHERRVLELESRGKGARP